MRVISMNGKIDIPYEQAVFSIERFFDIDRNMEPYDAFAIYAEVKGKKYTMAKYESEDNCIDIFEAVYTAWDNKVSVIQFPPEIDIEAANNGNA